MKVVGLVVVAISIGSSVVAAPSSTSSAASNSASPNSELGRKLGYAAVQLKMQQLIHKYCLYAIIHT